MQRKRGNESSSAKKKKIIQSLISFSALLILLLFFFGAGNTLSNWIGYVIHGYVTSGTFNMTITVVGIEQNPTVIINNPSNDTISKVTRILVDINATANSGTVNRTWYNIDNGTNTTYTGPINISVGDGNHILYAFANDSSGNVGVGLANFTVNTSIPFTINHSAFNGSTTNFSALNRSEQEQIFPAIIENTTFGKITFREIINITQDMSLNANIKLGNLSVNLSSASIPEFNKSANISLYGVTLTTPRILVDGSACPSTICTQISYNTTANIYTFNVSHFSAYSLDETPVEEEEEPAPTASAGGGGGGGGGGGRTTVVIQNQLVKLDIIVPSLIAIEDTNLKTTAVVLKNAGGTTLTGLSITATSLSEDIGISIGSLPLTTLEPGEQTSTQLTIEVDPNLPQGSHEVRIVAEVEDPQFSEAIQLLIDVQIRPEARDAQNKLDFAKNLLENNPTCAELQELITRAEVAVIAKNFREAQRLSEAAIQGCQGIISRGLRSIEKPQILPENRQVVYIAGITIALLIFAALLMKFLSRKEKRQSTRQIASASGQQKKSHRNAGVLIIGVLLLIAATVSLYFLVIQRGTDFIASSKASVPTTFDVSILWSRTALWFGGIVLLLVILVALRKIIKSRPKQPRISGGNLSVDRELERINRELANI